MTWEETARHELGHAVAAIAVGGRVAQVQVWVDAQQLHHGRCTYLLPPTANAMDEATAEMGGWAATWWRWPLDDVERAVALVGRDGLDEAMRRAAGHVAVQREELDELTGLLVARDVEAVAAMLREMACASG